MTQDNDNRAITNAKRNPMYRRKGWKGFVWGYKDWIKATEEEGRWDAINWNTKKCGAKEIIKDGNRTIYKY